MFTRVIILLFLISSVINATYLQPLSKSKVINDKSDFPVAISGRIPLEANVQYTLNKNVNLGTDYLDISNGGMGLLAIGSSILTYTGTDAVISGNIDTGKFVGLGPRLFLNAPNGSYFNVTGNGTLLAENVVFANSSTTGLISGVDINFRVCRFINTGGPLVMQNNGLASIVDFGFVDDAKNNSINFLEFYGDQPNITIDLMNSVASINERVIHISPTADVFARIQLNKVNPPTRFWSDTSLRQDDVRLSVLGNLGVEDSTAFIFAGVTGNVLTTTVPADTEVTPNLIAYQDDTERFEINTDNSFKYTGLETVKVKISGEFEIDPASGAATAWNFSIHKNDISEAGHIAYSDTPISVGVGLTGTVVTGATTAMETNDIIYFVFERTSGAGDAVITTAKVIINKL